MVVKPYIDKRKWFVKTVDLHTCQCLVAENHYAKGGSNTATYRHGLFRYGEPTCYGVAWWIPPTKSAAKASFSNWEKVLTLSRLVVVPEAPKNAASFLMAASRRMIDEDRWPCLVTYADELQGHTGAIYLADNWTFAGTTKPERRYEIDGRMVNRKAGPRTRTHEEMVELGAELVGASVKRKFVRISTGSKVVRGEGLERKLLRLETQMDALEWRMRTWL